MDKQNDVRKPDDKKRDDADHGVITAGPDAHRREHPGYAPPGDSSAGKDGGETEK